MGASPLILAFVFPAMIAAALALAYFGYQGAQNVVAIASGQFERNAAPRGHASWARRSTPS